MYVTSLKTEFIDNVLMDKDEELRKLIPDEGLLLNYFKACLKKMHQSVNYSVHVQ